MANESVVLWIDTQNNNLMTGWESNTPLADPLFKQGDNLKVELHFIRRVSTTTGIFFEEVPTTGSTFKLAIGKPDALPTGGQWTLAFGADEQDFAFDVSATDLETALNAFPDIIALGGVTVGIVNGNTTYRITFNEKVAVGGGFTGDGSSLFPSSSIAFDEIKVGSATTKGVFHIKLSQMPVAYQSVWTAQNPAEIGVSTIQTGTTRVEIYPQPKDGTFVLSVGGVTTPAIAIDASAGEVQQAIADPDEGFAVKKTGAYIWDITQTTTPLKTITATGAGLISFDSVVGNLSLNNYEVSTLLSGATRVRTTIEVEVTTGTTVTTVLQDNCVIVADIINATAYEPTPFETPLTDAPEDGSLYARQDGAWVSFTEEDNQGITQAEGDARYALPGATNSFSTNQIISGSTITAMLRVTQTGTGEALRVEDESPETTPFVVGADGRVGIHGTPASNTLHKLAVYNGDVLFTNGYGVSFGDGTRLTTAPAIGNFVSENDPRVLALSTDFIPQGVQSSVTVTVTYLDGFSGLDETSDIVITSPSGNYNGWSVVLTDSVTAGTFSINGTTITIGCNASTMQDALSALEGSSMDGWSVVGSGSPYAPSSVLELTTTVYATATSPYTDSSIKFLLREGLFPEIARLAQVANATNALVSVDSSGVVGFTDTYVDQSQLLPYALLSGANFTGKLTVSMSLSGSPVAQFDQTGSGGCVVIRSTSSSSTGHCLRIENAGTGSSLLVEDSVTPDTNAFIVNNNGVVGIQRPTTWTPAAGVFLDVGGKGVFTPTGTYSGINIGSASSSPTSTSSGDLWIGLNNIFFRDGNNATRIAANINSQNTFQSPQIMQATTASTLLRVTQTGTGNAFVVEDGSSTNPDTDSFVINNAGNVGIGVNPNTFVATEKLEVKGNIKFDDGTVQSTAFTTAQLPTSATATEARLSTNSTKFLTPDTAHWMMMSPNIINITRAGFTITNTGTITSATSGWISSATRTGTAGACSSRWRTFGLSQVDQVWSLTEKTSPANHLNFSNASHCSGRSLLQGITDSVFSWGFYHGKAEADGVGVLTRRGYGWRATGGAGSRFLSLEVHDGTTLTSVTSSYAIDGQAFDWDLISNGAGTVTLYVNGTQVATSTAGPTGTTNLTSAVWQEEVATSAASTSPYNGMVHSRGKFICFDS
jgi:hypothetical protein